MNWHYLPRWLRKRRKSKNGEWLSKSRKQFEASVGAAIKTSRETSGYLVDERLAWSTWLFTRIVAIAVNIEKLLDDGRHDKGCVSSLDYGCVSSLCRDTVETILMFTYVAEDVSADVWGMRKALLDLHDCVSREYLFRNLGVEEDATNFAAAVSELQKKLDAEPAFQKLGAEFRNKLRKGERAKVATTASLLGEIGADPKHYRAAIKQWSANIHATPLSWYRMHEHMGGCGVENERDKGYVAIALDYLVPYLDSASKRMTALLPAIEAEHEKRMQKRRA